MALEDCPSADPGIQRLQAVAQFPQSQATASLDVSMASDCAYRDITRQQAVAAHVVSEAGAASAGELRCACETGITYCGVP